ncbi:MAG: hypothetical protein VB122_07015, partial [Erysipelotrichales bacterium]|nr:hypothetical protein [Erysipelotrichales bacterium]
MLLHTERNSNMPHKFYTIILVYLSVSIAATIFILSSILYFTFENIGLSNIHSLVKDGLSQISYSSTFMCDLARSLSIQIYFDNNIS